jgi:hypothetical protein
MAWRSCCPSPPAAFLAWQLPRQAFFAEQQAALFRAGSDPWQRGTAPGLAWPLGKQFALNYPFVIQIFILSLRLNKIFY